MSNYEQKAGHPVLGIILGVLGVLIALLLSVFTGAIGGAVALLLGVGALLLGLFARKKSNRGIGAIIVGAIAIVLAISTTINSVNNFKALHKELEQYADEAPLVVASGVFQLGHVGFLGEVALVAASGDELDEHLFRLHRAGNDERLDLDGFGAGHGVLDQTAEHELVDAHA